LYPKHKDMTNILIPTDFTTASLQLAEKAITALDIKNAHIILFHAFELPTSEYELLSPGRQKPYAALMTDNFRQWCKQFKDQHSKAVSKIYFKFMEGSSSRLFRNFVDTNQIDLIICPDEYQYIPAHKLSVDPRPLFRKSGIKVIREFSGRKRNAAYESRDLAQVTFATS